MGAFYKYLLLNAAICLTLTLVAYLVARPSVEDTMSPGTPSKGFMKQVRQVDQLYAQYRQSFESGDNSQQKIHRANLKVKLSEINEAFGDQGAPGELARRYTHNYERLLTLHEAIYGDRQSVNERSKELTEAIRKLESNIENLKLELATL